MRESELFLALEKLGLTRNESKAYLSLVKNGVSNAREVSQSIGVQYPAVYRILESLALKSWVEISSERPIRYKARNPRVVAEEAREKAVLDLDSSVKLLSTLSEEFSSKVKITDSDLWIYKGRDNVNNKLRELVLGSESDILCFAPMPVDPEIFSLLFNNLCRAKHRVRFVLNEACKEVLVRMKSQVPEQVRIEYRFPSTHLPPTRLAHIFVFPSDKELFIVNTLYRDNAFVSERLQGLWISDMDYVRTQLEATVKGLEQVMVERALPRRRKITRIS